MYFLILDVIEIYQESIINIDFDWKFFGDCFPPNLSKCLETKIRFIFSVKVAIMAIHNILDQLLAWVIGTVPDRILDHILDHILDQILDQILVEVLDHKTDTRDINLSRYLTIHVIDDFVYL